MKITTKVDGKDVEIELTDEQIIEASKSNKGIIQKLREFLKIEETKPEENKKEEQKPEEHKNEDKKVPNPNKEYEELKKELEALKNDRANDIKQREEKNARIRENKAKKLLDNAIAEGRIARGETEELLKKYKANPSFLEDYLQARTPDNAIKRQNSENSQNGDNTKGGAKVFKESEIAKMSPAEYAKLENDILEAAAKGNIID